MKKILTIIIIVAMLAIGVFALTKVGNKDNVQPITINTEKLEGCMEGITLNVATTGTFAPFTYYDENGKDVIGFDLDVIKELQKLLGFEIANNEIPAMNAATITASITEGKVDMGLAALCATDERKQVMNFSDTYYEAGLIIAVNKETSPKEIKSLEDLKSGKYTVAVETGSASHLYAKEIGIKEDRIKTYNEGPIAFAALEDGKVDCFIQDEPGVSYYLKTKEDTKLTMIGEPFNQEESPYAIALSFDICKKYTNIQEVINLALKELTDNGTMSKIETKWCK